ncbi:MAG: hypothetical protein JNM55_12780 [Anaerolineales bacterium]|nr:hypothetical protein [Anaerolineales bacterium]
MQRRRLFLIAIAAGIMLVLAASFWLMTATPAKAQCGSQASSCKNCHEVQAEMPVNADGTGWHQSHAFGDFCYICHAGNNQATDKAEAHTGMVAPLADVEASCAQCHPADLTDRAQVYATTLGVEFGSGGNATVAETSSTVVTEAPAVVESQAAETTSLGTTEIDVDDPNYVDYAQRYDQIVLGIQPTNWGNVILIAMILMLLLGGGAYVLNREKLVSVSFGDTKKAGEEYSTEIVDMLPAISKLKPQSRKSLKNILDNPKKTEKVLGLIDEVISEEKE